ncbi:MAG: hypothetical protein L0215_23470 [Gemmataceae bacterium]|nr:hypothetical protein [Gemmataceae bacterium]
MAVDVEPKPAPAKFEAFVETQLSRVRQKIRALDAGRSLLALAIVTLVYFLLAASFDIAVSGADETLHTTIRLCGFGVYLLVVAFLLGQLFVRLRRSVNPFYAAKQLEETLPDAKNSVINWVDLKDVQLPGAIRTAIGMRAARELKQTDADKAVETKSNWLLAIVLIGLVLGVLVLFAMGPNQFGSLFGRAFAPFQSISFKNRTIITLLKPADGNIALPPQRSVVFQARIDGRFPRGNHPNAPRLLYRYQQEDVFVTLPLDENADFTWGAVLVADQVRSGLWYKIAAGDAETPEYQVQVLSQPQATGFEVKYEHRPYRKLTDEVVVFPNENAIIPRLWNHRGTVVTLLVRTNRTLKHGRIDIEAGGQKQELWGELLKDDPRTFQVRWTMEKSGTFRVVFTSIEGEENIDRTPYPLEVLDDRVPLVVIDKPGKDVSAAANDTVVLEGRAEDDLGLKQLVLRLRVLEGNLKPELEPKPYRPEKSFQFDDGAFPTFLEYKDVLTLNQLMMKGGKPLPVEPGMILEYWLEAVDNSDYPSKDGNIGRSQSFKIAILAPSPDQKKQDKDRQDALDKQKQHEKKQDQEHAKQNRDRQDKKDPNDPEQKKRDEKLRNDVQNKLDKLKEELDRQKNQGESKGQDPPKSETKGNDPGEQPKADNKDQKPGAVDGPGDKKDEGKNGDKSPPAEAKDKGPKQDGKQPDASSAKGPGDDQKPAADAKGPDPTTDPKKGENDTGTAKNAPPNGKGGETKDEGPQKSKEPQAGGKGGGSEGQNSGASASKSPEAGKEEPNAQAKENAGGGQGAPKAAAKNATGKDAETAQNKDTPGMKPDLGEVKPGPGGDGETQATATAKGDPAGDKAGAKSGPGDPKAQPQTSAKGDGKGGVPQANPKATPPDVAKDSGLTKDHRGKPTGKEPSAEDLARLKKELENSNDKNEALDELTRMAKEAKDKDVRKAAEELLDKIGQEMPKTAQSKDDKGVEIDKPGNTKPDTTTDKVGKAPDLNAKPAPKQGEEQSAKGPGDGKPGEPKSDVKPGGNAGNMGPGGQAARNDYDVRDPNAAFSKRGGNLQLEDLKSRMNDDTLKKLGWTQEDWDRFVRDAQVYEELLRRQQKSVGKQPPDKMMGGPSQLPNQVPRKIENKNTSTDPLQFGRPQPPPEFREAFRQFTGGKSN